MQHGLHETLRLTQVEQTALLRSGAHLQDALFLVPERVALGARGNANRRLIPCQRTFRHIGRERHNLLLGGGVALLLGASGRAGCLRLCHGVDPISVLDDQ